MRERPCVQSGSRRVSSSHPQAAGVELRLKLQLGSAPALIQVIVGREVCPMFRAKGGGRVREAVAELRSTDLN
jgi:hypothetical protein